MEENFELFVSWSKKRSRIVAEVLRDWLADVIQNLKPWMSATDIDAGERWNAAIAARLEASNFGVFVITKENVIQPWILFEAGAIGKKAADSRVCLYLIGGTQTSDIPQGPLTQFQAKIADEAGTWDLLKSINKSLGDRGLPEDRLRRAFDSNWEKLETVLDTLPEPDEAPADEPDINDMVKEILDITRGLSRSTSSRPVRWQELMEGWKSFDVRRPIIDPTLAELSRRRAHEHHLTYDGTGYPKLSPEARIDLWLDLLYGDRDIDQSEKVRIIQSLLHLQANELASSAESGSGGGHGSGRSVPEDGEESGGGGAEGSGSGGGE